MTRPTRRLGLGIGCLALGLGVAAFWLGAQVASGGWPLLGFGERPGARVRSALAEADPLVRISALVQLLRGLDPEDLDEVVEAYEASFRGPAPGEAAIALLCETWAPYAGQSAVERIQQWPAPARSEGMRACLRSWARREPLAASEWAGRSGEDIDAAFKGWADSGDPAMWDFVARMGQGMQRERASNFLMQSVAAREGLDNLLARVEALPDDAPGRFKLAAFRTAVGIAANLDPARALDFVERHAGGPYDRSLLQRLAVRQVRRDGPGTMQMLLEWPSGTERDWALREAYLRWLRADREEALSWVPEGVAGDPRFVPLCDLYAVALARSDPQHPEQSIARAVRWSQDIPDAKKQRETWIKLGGIWLSLEPEAARSWLAERGLEDEVAQRRRFFLPSRAAGGGRAPRPEMVREAPGISPEGR